MIEVLFLISQFQCGESAPQATFQVEIVEKGQSYTLKEGETTLINGINDFSEVDELIYHKVADASCALDTPPDDNFELLKYESPLPTLPAAYNQKSLEDIKNNHLTDEYYQVQLLELGTTNTESKVFDLQDIVLRIDTDPNNEKRVTAD